MDVFIAPKTRRFIGLERFEREDKDVNISGRNQDQALLLLAGT